HGTQLAGSALEATKHARVSFIAPSGISLGGKKGISVLSFTFLQKVGSLTLPPDGSLVGNVTFSDCGNGSTRVETRLKDSKGSPVGTAKGYAGSSGDFKSLCQNTANPLQPITLDFVNDLGARWDISGLTGKYMSLVPQTFAQLKQGASGSLIVDSVAFVNDPA